jgi:PAS domain S-box-containing protein
MIELSILISLGSIIMLLAVYKTQQLTNLHLSDKYQKAWIVLKYFMIAFFIGYVFVLVFILLGYSRTIQSLTGLIFFFGALFVYITIRTGFNTIDDLHKTTVSKKYVDKIVNSMADTLIVLEVGPDLRINKVNQVTLNLLGYKEAELINYPIKKIIGSDEKLLKYLDELGVECWLTNKEVNYLTKEGNKIPMLLSISCIRDTNNKILELILAAQNITQRKMAEKLEKVLFNISAETSSLEDLTALYKAIHSHLDEVLDTTNLFFGMINEDETELSFPYFIDEYDPPPEPIKIPQKLISDYVIKTKKPLFLKKQDIIDLADKNLIDLDISGTISEVWIGTPLLNQGRAIGLIVLQSYHDPDLYTKSDLKILTFVAEQIAKTIVQKQSITDLEVEKTYLNELFTSSPEALALVTPDSTILHINTKFTSLFGHSEEEVIGKNIDDLLPSPKNHKDAEIITQDVALGKSVYFDAVRKKKDGTKINVSVLGAPVNYKGDVLAVFAIYRDITDRIKAAKTLKRSEEKYRSQSIELSESDAMKELLLDIITHDLRNPAGVIKGFAQFGLETDPKNEILIEIDEGVDNLLNVISNATTLSKVTIGDTINKEELDLVSIIKIAIDGNSSQLEFAEMKLDFKMVKKLKITANPIICEVFRNYISNAIKYAIAGKKIIVEVIEENDFITINVKDFGETIKQKDRENIFVRNVQLGKTKGRGLGLAIVKRIADAHNAEVGVIPNKPNGNIFYFKLPLATIIK